MANRDKGTNKNRSLKKPIELAKNPGLEKRWEGLVGQCPAQRADKYIAEVAGVLTRSQIKARNAILKVNKKSEKFSKLVKTGDILELNWREEPSHTLEAEQLEVSIIYEDPSLFVFNKAQGMVTHPAAGNWRGTLANAALWLDSEKKGRGEIPRGGIVHRLDKDTSGVIIVARTIEALEFLSAQFKSRKARKEYLAIVQGHLKEARGRIENSLGRDKRDRKKFAPCEVGGKLALTEYRVLAEWSVGQGIAYTLVALFPRTGRTHQLRVHMAGLGCPILGDPLYGRRDQLFDSVGLMLHAWKLLIQIPGTKEPRLFKAPIPQRFKDLITSLDKAGRRFSRP